MNVWDENLLRNGNVETRSTAADTDTIRWKVPKCIYSKAVPAVSPVLKF